MSKVIHIHVGGKTKDAMTKSALQNLVAERFEEFSKKGYGSAVKLADARRKFSEDMERAIRSVQIP